MNELEGKRAPKNKKKCMTVDSWQFSKMGEEKVIKSLLHSSKVPDQPVDTELSAFAVHSSAGILWMKLF